MYTCLYNRWAQRKKHIHFICIFFYSKYHFLCIRNLQKPALLFNIFFCFHFVADSSTFTSLIGCNFKYVKASTIDECCFKYFREYHYCTFFKNYSFLCTSYLFTFYQQVSEFQISTFPSPLLRRNTELIAAPDSVISLNIYTCL